MPADNASSSATPADSILGGKPGLRICVVYDCLYPWTIGGAERWYRQLARAYAAAGHEVTYLTMCQWARDNPPHLPGIKVIAVAPRMALYANGKRRPLPPILFGIGVACHLLRRGGRYDVVHAASFPFFSVLAAALARPLARFRLMVDWHEVWSREYWAAYLGAAGRIGWLVQRLCAMAPQRAFTFSQLHAARARALGLHDITVLHGEYDGAAAPACPARSPPFVLYAGRMIPEKRVALLVEALALLMRGDDLLEAVLIGQGPELPAIRARVEELGLAARISLPGFVDKAVLEDCQSRAAAMVLPSEREGYGMVVVESAARGVPVVVVAGEDNAAVELVDEGENGFVAPAPTPEALARSIALALAQPARLRASTAGWYARNVARLSFSHSFAQIIARLAARA